MPKDVVNLFLCKIREDDALKKKSLDILKNIMSIEKSEDVTKVKQVLTSFVKFANENGFFFSLEDLISAMSYEKKWIIDSKDEIIIKSGKKFARCMWDAVNDLFGFNCIKLYHVKKQFS